MKFEPTPQRFQIDDDPIIFRFNHTSERELFEIDFMPEKYYQSQCGAK